MGKKYLSKLEEMGKLPVLCDRDPNKAVSSYPFYCHFEEVKEPVKAVIIAVDPAEHVRLAKFFWRVEHLSCLKNLQPLAKGSLWKYTIIQHFIFQK